MDLKKQTMNGCMVDLDGFRLFYMDKKQSVVTCPISHNSGIGVMGNYLQRMRMKDGKAGNADQQIWRQIASIFCGGKRTQANIISALPRLTGRLSTGPLLHVGLQETSGKE